MNLRMIRETVRYLKRHGKEQATLVATALRGGADAAKGAGKAKGNAAR